MFDIVVSRLYISLLNLALYEVRRHETLILRVAPPASCENKRHTGDS